MQGQILAKKKESKKTEFRKLHRLWNLSQYLEKQGV